jgi:pullulanase
MIEKNRVTKGGNPAGFDYLKSLGITHLQLLPFYDFASVDEENWQQGYNWGYDPAQYFVPEGSYASDVHDPYSRLIDLKKMVAAFHKEGIRIVMDVVFNHVYEHQTSVFEKVVPNYYFRREYDGKIAQRSFCGNDLATERSMVRKLIVDACTYYAREFGVDGFRYDIMGLIDVETIKIIRNRLWQFKPDFMFYGEGWQMGDEQTQRINMASFTNAFDLEGVGFFNDWYRDIVRGTTFDHDMLPRGYLLNEVKHRANFEFLFLGSAIDRLLKRRFINPTQSINFVECHDNGTIYDKLEVALPAETHEQRLERVKLFNAVVMTSFGVPFIHMGQEIGLSKKGHQNTYKAGDAYNKMDYALLDERYDLVNFMRDLVKIRKAMPWLREAENEEIQRMVSFEELSDNAIMVKYDLREQNSEYKESCLFINPSLKTVYYNFDDYHQLLLTGSGDVYRSQTFVKHLMIKPITLLILLLK